MGRLGYRDHSISWDANFGKSYDDLFFEVYGIQPDLERIRFYRELWDED